MKVFLSNIAVGFISVWLGVVAADCDVASETTATGTYYTPPSKLCPGDLIFEDNFDTFDTVKWAHEVTLSGGGNGEFEYYRNNRSNSYAQDGHLHIKPTYLADDYGEDFLYSGTLDLGTECNNANHDGCVRTGSESYILNPIESARVRTIESFYFKYGTVEVRAKMPAGDWLWPAVWLLPHDNAYGDWPISGEIDLLESRGNRELTNPSGVHVGNQQVSSTLLWAPSMATIQWGITHYERNNVTGYDNDFHIYKMVWTSDGVVMYLDDVEMGSVFPSEGGFWEYGGYDQSGDTNPWSWGSKMAPFDKEFYLLINLAIGGTNGYFADTFTNAGGKPWSNTSPHSTTEFWEAKNQWEPTWNLNTDDSHLIVDYVRVYAV